MAGKKYYGMERKGNLGDGSMIREEYDKPSNLPTNVMRKAYPRTDAMYFDVPDTISSIDAQMNQDVRGGKKRKPSQGKF